MASLAIFDFDRTIVDGDSDATIINRLREKQPPPEWEAGRHDWTPYMNDIFERAHSAGLQPSEILSCISKMRATPGMPDLLRSLHRARWRVLLLSDANRCFITHWLSEHQLTDTVSGVITNSARFEGGRLMISPCMTRHSCPRCPPNLCKGAALEQCTAAHHHTRVVYVGDGTNDFCPAMKLPKHAIVFPRKGYPLDELIKKDQVSSEPRVQAAVVPWEDAYTIMGELFPERDPVIPL